MGALFSQEILQAGAVKGLSKTFVAFTTSTLKQYVRFIHNVEAKQDVRCIYNVEA